MTQAQSDTSTESEIDLSDIARGRRITAVVASEMDLTPRKGERPPQRGLVDRMRRSLSRLIGFQTY